MEPMIVVYVAPGQNPEIKRMEDSPDALASLIGCAANQLQFFLVPGGTALWYDSKHGPAPNMFIAGKVFDGPAVITNVEPYGDGDMRADTLGDVQAMHIAHNLKGRKYGKGKV